MSVMQPWNSNVKDKDFFTIPGTSGFAQAFADFRKSKVLFVHAFWSSAANTGAQLRMDATEDPALSSGIVVMTPTVTYAAVGLSPTITAGVLTIPSAASGAVIMVYEHCPSYVRPNYSVSSGGGPLTVYLMGRAT